MDLAAPDNIGNPGSYVWTGHVHFAGEQDPNLITIQGFRTLLENTYELRLAECKKPSYVRTREWLYAIWKKFPKPPGGYRGTEATWKHEIGYTKDKTSKWFRHPDGHFCVYSTTGNTTAPHTPVEDMYHIMTTIHRQHGHRGRDRFYNLVKAESASITKDFCNSFVNVCCPQASYWQNGNVLRCWLPPKIGKEAAEKGDGVEEAPPMDLEAIEANDGFEENLFMQFEAGLAAGGFA